MRRDVMVAGVAVIMVTVMSGCVSDEQPPAGDATAPAAPSGAPAAAASEQAPASSAPSAAPTASERAKAGGDESEPPCPVSTRRPKNEAPFAADVDGDGRRDDVFLLKHPKVGVSTAAGGFSSFEVPTAKPFSLLGAEDANGDGRDELFVGLTTGDESGVFSGVHVAVHVDCEMRLARNVEGDPYTFVKGTYEGELRGMGCVEIDGLRRLVGLTGRKVSEDRVRWKRTVVEMDGDRFTNGAVARGTFTRPRDNAAIRLLGEVTCGKDDLGSHYGS